MTMKNTKGEVNLLMLSMIAIIAIALIVSVVLFYGGSSGFNNASFKDFNSERTINAENSGKGNTQFKDLRSGNDMNINTGTQSGN